MNPAIVVFVDQRYAPIAANWLAAVERLGLERHVVLVTLDSDTERSFAASNVDRLFRPLDSRDFGDLLIHRIRILTLMITDGRDIIHSDPDAVWLANPLEDLLAPGFDMMFSQGTVWPPDIHKKRGIVACCGLFAVRASSRTREFFAVLEQRVAVERNDQSALNHLLDEILGPWHVERPAHAMYSGKTFLVSNEIITAKAEGMKVGVLPFHRYPRLMSGPQGVVVGHPLSGKTAAETEEALRRHGLWGDGSSLSSLC